MIITKLINCDYELGSVVDYPIALSPELKRAVELALHYHMRVRCVRMWGSDGYEHHLWLEQRLDYDPQIETWELLGWCYGLPCSLSPTALAAYIKSPHALAMDTRSLSSAYVSDMGLAYELVAGGEFDLPPTLAEYVAALPRKYRAELMRYYHGVRCATGYGTDMGDVARAGQQQQAHMRKTGVDWYTEYGVPRLLKVGVDVHTPIEVSAITGIQLTGTQVIHGSSACGAYFVNTSVVADGIAHDLLCARTQDPGSLRKGLGFAAILHNITACIQHGVRRYSLAADNLPYKQRFWPAYATPQPLLRVGSVVEVLMGVRNFWLKGQWVEDPVRDGLPLLTHAEVTKALSLRHIADRMTPPPGFKF